MQISGNIRKMVTRLGDAVDYQLPVGDELIPVNSLIGQNLRLEFLGEIHCIECGRKTSKSFNQGYCYPCFRSLAQCDSCIVKPEQCHYFEGTCREPAWGEQHCLQDHVVYLANSSGIKVGITRGSQIPIRWMDQGASQALPILRVKNRLVSGLAEMIFKQHVADKTAWQRMLKGEPEPVDLPARRDALFGECEQALQKLAKQQGDNSLALLHDEPPVEIRYPVQAYPAKVASLNFDKTPLIEGVLQGIKGQYLILSSGVLNMRKFSGYNLKLTSS
ncbi:MAG: DUF2797 domain-containing protein [Thiohalophilus sp.]|uniref:DUF2797 domain-containing protein n=1 Tax=Thiohalophilus sp. TaxID=3028392 RepID=UPI00286FB59C|nr:DUF2797 domain-containing protein [Thiohalophilus sp.]MDR9436914.1 DUF2797 domain-containing protein [Thiohalophilus sp.]